MDIHLPYPSPSIVLDGDLTIERVSQVWAQLQQALLSQLERGVIALDLSAVVQCDGAGLQLLVAFSRAAAARGSTIVAADIAAPLAALLTGCGLADLFIAAPDTPGALITVGDHA